VNSDYEDQVRSDIRAERAITFRAAVPLALVAPAIGIYLIVHG
jgi:hypothetical protein